MLFLLQSSVVRYQFRFWKTEYELQVPVRTEAIHVILLEMSSNHIVTHYRTKIKRTHTLFHFLMRISWILFKTADEMEDIFVSSITSKPSFKLNFRAVTQPICNISTNFAFQFNKANTMLVAIFLEVFRRQRRKASNPFDSPPMGFKRQALLQPKFLTNDGVNLVTLYAILMFKSATNEQKTSWSYLANANNSSTVR